MSVSKKKKVMEGLIEQLKTDYPVESVERNDDGVVDVDCGRLTGRLDHYTCGEEGCGCYEAEGWCEWAWEENCVGPITKEFDEWKKKHLPSDIEAWGSVGEKGWFYVTLKPLKEKEPASKKAKKDDELKDHE